MLRKLYCLTGVAAGSYVGAMQGAAIGATFGSVVFPVVGTVAGSLIGWVVGAVLGGAVGALFTKYTAGLISTITCRDTATLEKLRLTPNQTATISQKPNLSAHVSWVLKAMDAVMAREKKASIFENTEKWRRLLTNLKEGKFTVRETKEEKNPDFSGCSVWLDGHSLRPPDEMTSTHQTLRLYTSYKSIVYYFSVDGKRENFTLPEQKSFDFPVLGTRNETPTKLDPSSEEYARILKRTAERGHTGSKPAIEMSDPNDDAELTALYRQGLFEHNDRYATTFNSRENNNALWQSPANR